MPTVSDYMVSDPITLSPGMSVHRARRLLVEHEISGAPVVDERGRLVGMFTERDIIGAVFRASYHQDPGSSVEDCMAPDVETLEADMDITEAAKLFLESRFRRFPVLSSNRMVGLLSRRDVLRAVEDLWRPGVDR